MKLGSSHAVNCIDDKKGPLTGVSRACWHGCPITVHSMDLISLTEAFLAACKLLVLQLTLCMS